MVRILVSAIHTQNSPSGPFTQELYGIKYQSVNVTSPPMANPLDFPSASHSNPYATPLYHLFQSCNFQESSSSR